MRLAYRLLLLLTAIILATALPAQSQEYLPEIKPTSIKPLKSDSDPTQYCIKDILIDSQGRMWFSTCGVAQELYSLRVVQFDGYNIRPLSIAREGWKGYLKSILEGESREIGFYGFLNRHPDQSTLFSYDLENNEVKYSPIKDIAGGIIEEASGQFWVLLKGENTFTINKWDGHYLEKYAAIPARGMYHYKNDLYFAGDDIPFIKRGTELWFCDQDLPIYAFDIETKGLKNYGVKNFPAYLQDTQNIDLKIQANTDIIEHQGSLYAFHNKRNAHFQILRYNEQQFMPFPIVPQGYEASGIYKDSLDQLLFIFSEIGNGKDQGGLLIDKDGKSWDYSAMIKKLPPINAIRGDNFFDEVYVATQKGAYLVTNGKRTAISSLNKGNGFRSVQHNAVGNLFVKYGNGLGQIYKDQIREIEPSYCFEAYLKKNGEYYLISAPDSRIWLKTRKDIIRYVPNKDQSCEIHHFDFELGRVIFLSPSSLVVIEQKTSKLHFYDLETRVLEEFKVGGQSLRFQGVVHNLLFDENNILWVASNEGLYKIDIANRQSTHYGANDDFEDHRILVIEKDQQGLIWLGTVYGGVHLFDPKQEKVTKVINNANGLSNNTVVSILEDNNGDIWVGTYDGLNLLNPDGNIIANFNTEDGLSHYEFNRYSYYKDENGLLYMGTVLGLNIIDPVLLKKELNGSKPPEIYLTKLSYYSKKLDKKVNTQHLKSFDETIVLEADQRNITVNVGMSNYGFSSKNRYAYQLEGINKEWNYIGNDHQIKLFNLPAGTYRLLITGIDHNGNRSANTIRIPIHAKEFFYKQAWFYILMAIPFLIFALLWIQRLNKEKDMLEKEVDKRTIQILKDKELIEQQAVELKQLDQMKSRFFANISHDFRTPLTLITGPAELMKKDEALPQKTRFRQSLQSILQNGKKLLRLVDEILDLAKIESHQIKLYEEEVALHSFSESIFMTYQDAAQRQHIQYQFNYHLSNNYALLTDPRRLEKILSNLLGNAFKFTTANDSISLNVFLEQEEVYFEVKDTGRGIPLEDLPHIFDRYFQSRQEDFLMPTGDGIGLSLSMELTKLMGGHIQVESVYEQGSTFTLTLPAKASEKKDTATVTTDLIPQETEAVQIEETIIINGEVPTILIVEDNLEVQEFIKSILSQYYQVVTCNNGMEALQFLKEKEDNQLTIDLLLSDINMPKMNGYELLAAVKQDRRLQQIPMIMLTAHIKEKNKFKALRMGVDDYLTKPFSPTELLLRIQNLLDNYKKRIAYQEDYYQLATQSEGNLSTDQAWLESLEEVTLSALDKKMDLSISYLSNTLAISERHLSRKVKLLTGLTIGKYIQQIKLQKARHLLENRIISTVAEASYLSGFNSPGYFTKVYQKYYGKIPSSYL